MGAMDNATRTTYSSEKFWITASDWVKPVHHVQSADFCCVLCQRSEQCLVWTWVNFSDGQPSQCQWKGGGLISRVKKHGVVSGFRSNKERERAHDNVRWHGIQIQAQREQERSKQREQEKQEGEGGRTGEEQGGRTEEG